MTKTSDTKKRADALKERQSLKERFADAIVLARIGDFYEAYFNDAYVVSSVLGITLTKINGKVVAGFPYHGLDNYLSKLIHADLRVCIL